MTQEDYCSFEVAKLLKEKGFNWDCITYYVDSEPDNVKYSMLFENNTTWEERCCSAPTLQMARKWLREKYNIHIEPRYFPTPNIYRYVIIHSPITIENIDSHPQYFDTYEEAVEAALRYSLENFDLVMAI